MSHTGNGSYSALPDEDYVPVSSGHNDYQSRGGGEQGSGMFTGFDDGADGGEDEALLMLHTLSLSCAAWTQHLNHE